MRTDDPSPGPMIVRADASSRIGAGHVMRSLALAQHWLDRRGEVTFLSSCQNAEVRQRIQAAGVGFLPLPSPHPDPVDLQATLALAARARSQRPDPRSPWVVLDGYQFDSEYQSALRTAGFRLLVIDDMAHHERYHADVLLNQNAGAETLPYCCNEGAEQLLGPRFVLLRSEFSRWSSWKRRVPAVARRVMVSLGASDPENATLSVVRALASFVEADVEVRVVAGAANPHIDELREAVAQSGRDRRLHLLTNVADMPGQMAWADLAVSAGGSTCWELAYMGVPNLVLVVAANQSGIAAALESEGVSINLGWHGSVCPPVLARKLELLLYDGARRQRMSDRGRALVDGRGTQRVVDALCRTGHRSNAHSFSGE